MGNKFPVKTDHNILRYFLTQNDLNERKQKWASKAQEFYFDIKYVIEVKSNVVLDSLSRRPSIFLMDVAEDWKDILEVEYTKDKFVVKFLMGLTMMICIRCWI